MVGGGRIDAGELGYFDSGAWYEIARCGCGVVMRLFQVSSEGARDLFSPTDIVRARKDWIAAERASPKAFWHFGA